MAGTGFKAGELIENRYRILSVIETGGMGTLYRVTDEARGSEIIALKMVRLDVRAVDESERVTHFQREFQLLTQLRHPNLVPVHDYGITAEGQLYFTMEWVEGQELKLGSNSLQPGATVLVIIQICRALAYLHARGVVHGDLKPANVLLLDDAAGVGPRVKIVDFGLTSEIRSHETRARYCTLGYSAPELRKMGSIDYRTDLYSLGALWYALLLGEAPMFMFGVERMIRFSLDEALGAQIQIPAALSKVIARLLATPPEDRYDSANKVIQIINEVTGSNYALETRETATSYALRSRFVDRETEMAALRAAWEHAQSQPGKLVLVGGESGVGKTRLIEEFAIQVKLGGARVVRGQCVEGAGFAYRPWREVLRVLIRHVEGANRLHLDLPRLASVLTALLPELEEREYLQGIAPPVDLAPQAAQQRLNRAIVQAIHAAATLRPTLLIIEDAQWADEASLEMLLYLTRTGGQTGLLTCVTYRSGKIPPEHPLVTMPRESEMVETLLLDSLTPETTTELVRSMLGLEQLPETLAQRVQQTTGGNAFFIQELIRSLAEDGQVLQRTIDGWRIDQQALERTHLPDLIRQVVWQRLAHLSPTAQRVLQWAAVLGPVFWDGAVEVIGQVPREQVEAALQESIDQELIVERQACALAGQREYLFTNPTVREVNFESFPADLLQDAHRQTAAWLIAHGEEQIGEYLGQIAEHLERAGETELAVIYLCQAGEQSAAQFANTEATGCFGRALRLTPQDDLEKRYLLLLKREKVYGHQGVREAQQQDLLSLKALVRSLADDRRKAEVALRQARYAEVTSDYPSAIAAAQEAIRAAQAIQDTGLQATGHLEWGIALFREGDYKAAHTRLEQALTLAREGGNRYAEAESLHYLGIVSSDQGQYEQAEAYTRQALPLYREIGQRVGESDALNTLGILCLERGDHRQGRRYYEQALHIAREIGHRQNESRVLINLGNDSLTLGDYAEARRLTEEGMRGKLEIGDREGWSVAQSNLAWLLHLVGENQAAREQIIPVLQVTQETGERRSQGYALTILGYALEGLRQLEEAAESYQQAIDLRRELGQRHLATESLAGLARVSLAQGNLTLALAQTEEILAYLENDSLDGTEEPLRIYLTCYRVLRANGDSRAWSILNVAHQALQEQATAISDEEMRRSFLQNIPSHQEIVCEYSRTESTKGAQTGLGRKVADAGFQVGELIENRYRVLAVIAKGGMGTLYRVADEVYRNRNAYQNRGQDNDVLALKMVRLDGEGREHIGRFQREFQLLAQLRHPNLVSVYNYGITTGGQLYFTMDWVEGQDLEARGSRLAPGDSIAIVVQVCRALAYLHSRGVIHGDLKPANVLLVERQVKIVDFGIALEIRSPETQMYYYSPGYSAPEMKESVPIDHRADLYSLGALWYTLLVGEAPTFMFGGEHLIQYTLRKTLEKQSQVTGEHIPVAVGDVIVRLLAMSPHERYDSANETLDAINQITGSTHALETQETISSYALRVHFVNREAEMQVLQTLWEQAQSKQGGLVLINGKGGVGKTRLLEELEVQAELGGAWVVWGQCVERGGNAYRPWREVLRMLVRYVEAGDAASARQVGPVLATLLPELWERDYMVDASPPAELDPQAAQQRLNNAIVQVLRAAADLRPSMIVIEDAHWADEATLALLDLLARTPGQLGVLICVTYRVEEVDPDHPLSSLAGERVSRVPLQVLTPEHTSDLVCSMLGLNELPALLSERVQQTTEGNAFFVQELIRSLAVEGQVLQRTVTGWQVDDDALQKTQLPESIRHVVWRRLGQLSENAQEVIGWAAVTGKTFWEGNLAAIGQVTRAWVRRALYQGVEQDLIIKRDQSAFVGDHEYLFNSSVIREASYENISPEKRRAYHERVAAWLLGRRADQVGEHMGLIAEHLEKSGQVAQAVVYLIRAGKQAVAQFANAEAITHFGRALNLTPEDKQEQRYTLLSEREKVYDLQGAREAQTQDLIALQALVQAADDDRWRIQVALRQAHYADVTGDYLAAILATQDAIDLAQATQDTDSEAAGYLEWGWILLMQQDFSAASIQLECGLALARMVNARQVEVDCLRYLGSVAYYRGNYVEARDNYEQSLDICRQIGDRQGESAVLNNLGLITQQGQGDYARAESYFKKGLVICLEIGYKLGESIALVNLGLLSHQMGDDSVGRDYSERALSMAREVDARRVVGYALTNLGHALAGLEHLAEAIDVYQQAAALRRELGQFNLVMEALAGLARVHVVQGDLAQAKAQVEVIVGYLENNSLDGTQEPFRVYLTCYRVLRADQDPRAGTILRAAHDLLQERAAKISDEDIRHSFLENVAARREIMSECRSQRSGRIAIQEP